MVHIDTVAVFTAVCHRRGSANSGYSALSSSGHAMTRRHRARVRVRLWPVGIAAVVDVQHYDLAALFVDAIPHSVLTAPGPPQAVERGP